MREVEVHTDRPLRRFAELAHLNRHRLSRVWLLSPWLGGRDDPWPPLALLADAVRCRRGSLVLYTRTPAAEYHIRGVSYLSREAEALVFTLDSLHAKLFILECDGFTSAHLGSANFTQAADEDNLELYVEFRVAGGTGESVRAVVRSLIDYASGLRGDEAAQVYTQPG